jgi:hypothetical protein
MKYLEVVNSGIEVDIYYCEKHKEYFSNNCSECMLDANDPDTIRKAKAEAYKEVIAEMESRYRAPTKNERCHDCAKFILAVVKSKFTGKPQEGE